MLSIRSQKIYDEFWKFAANRQELFYNKLRGVSPLTNDEILKEFKFCNAYRVLDRVSQYLISNVIYCGNFSAQDTIFRIVFFKIFNLPSTWESLKNKVGEICLNNFDFTKYSKALGELKQKQAIYNNAYISCANKAFGFDAKHDNHLKLLEKMFLIDNLSDKILKCENMQKAFELFINYPLIGNFMAYQLITDINYSDAVNWSEAEFTVAGPGSIRGINKVFSKFNSYEEAIVECYNRQEFEFKRLGLNFKYIKNHSLQYIDIQNLFCEFDKYCRQAHPELKSNRTKIKTKYKPTNKIIDYKLPPKWNAELM